MRRPVLARAHRQPGPGGRRAAGALREWDHPVERLTARRAAALEPALRVPAGVDVAYCPSEGFLHGEQAVAALLGRATAGGARVISGGEVSREMRGTRVVAARVPGGNRVTADIFVSCADDLGPYRAARFPARSD